MLKPSSYVDMVKCGDVWMARPAALPPPVAGVMLALPPPSGQSMFIDADRTIRSIRETVLKPSVLVNGEYITFNKYQEATTRERAKELRAQRLANEARIKAWFIAATKKAARGKETAISHALAEAVRKSRIVCNLPIIELQIKNAEALKIKQKKQREIDAALAASKKAYKAGWTWHPDGYYVQPCQSRGTVLVSDKVAEYRFVMDPIEQKCYDIFVRGSQEVHCG